ncbi:MULTISPECIES: peptidase domain-containing ABC transporter [unclassified Chitinophaga]|uniref:peptidase domain-containing ABC transporter n=1 Tax=unclassified Chitinophaga TaxID=2619133 RepID=UPI0009C9E941|nr:MULTISPECIES: peptidase domain-containing ABC transporter [unclassified Chitinophaga]OMP78187.1 hypothetical protein BW716_15530 [[Flexibacter] sp. ATCC 35208]WPV66363.1 peptidase domain-containing ABC transporter [Chitinophaga sp. LS1]
MIRTKQFPFFKQPDSMDCGPTCLKMITAWHGKHFPLTYLRKICYIGKEGTTIASLSNAASLLGFKTLAAEIPVDVLAQKVPLPCILHWEKAHFVVLTELNDRYAVIADPSLERMLRLPHPQFVRSWCTTDKTVGRALLLEPTTEFFGHETPAEENTSLWWLLPYTNKHRRLFIPLLMSVLLASGFALIIPLLTQQIVDKGIRQQNPQLLMLICLGQLMLFTGRTIMDFIRARWLFRIGAQTGISLLRNYLSRLMQLKFAFFDNRQAGDNMQRVTDNQRIEDFLTNNVISFVMSALTLLVFGIVLLIYNWRMFLVFLIGALLSIAWAKAFTQKRRLLDQQKFKVLSANQQLLLEIFYAMQEIKLTGSEQEKQDKWESLQVRSYELKMQSLQLDQQMQGIGNFLNEVKNILLTFMAAWLVIKGSLSLGEMLAVTYICGQLNTPVVMLLEFMRAAQNTRFSLSRMSEVFNEPEEDAEISRRHLPEIPKDINISNLSFRYGQLSNPLVLKNIYAFLPAGKVTAIVGMSGSGKSTLIKLLLKFYAPVTGTILVNDIDLKNIHAADWRSGCGVVMQDGYIFSDTIANNIYAGSTIKDQEKLYYAAAMANMHDFFQSMPYGYETVIGKDGHGLSEGQKQRLLIARMIYRDPAYIFLDEATNALDANNERTIVNNLQNFFVNKTVIIVAHRLSTVRHADQIIVMDKGEIRETGTHEDLIKRQGNYYHLIKNQLELGK